MIEHYCIGCKKKYKISMETMEKLEERGEAEFTEIESSRSGRYKVWKGRCPKGHKLVVILGKA